jgi:T3SS negative regulator,GrlR
MPKIDGLWSVEFYNNSGNIGAGVVVINNGRILGGDSIFMYDGTLRQENISIYADLEVSKHCNIPSQSIFGPIDHFHLKLSGSSDSNNLSLEGYVAENPQQKINIRAFHRSKLIA